MSGFDGQLWKCSTCEDKNQDIKSVLQSLQSLHSEMKTMKSEHQTEREQILEGLKEVKKVAKRLDTIETTQMTHGTKLDDHDKTIAQQTKKIEDNSSKLVSLEDQIQKIDAEALCIRQTNAVVREIREIEKRERNIIVCNVPESKEETSEGRKKFDEEKIRGILAELESTETRPVNVIRVGMKGKYPRKILLILSSVDECEKILKKAERIELANTVFITRDRTFNQRAEARQYRMEREKEEKEGKPPRGRGRGRGRGVRGVGRPARSQGSVRGRGGRENNPSLQRKRRLSQEEDESKRRRTEERDELQVPNGNLPKDSPTSNVDPISLPDSSPTRRDNGRRPNTPKPAKQPLSAVAPAPTHCDLNC